MVLEQISQNRVIRTKTKMLITDIYTKSTDNNGLLYYKSCHPRHVKNALLRSQFVKVQRIVSDKNTCNERLQQMSKNSA